MLLRAAADGDAAAWNRIVERFATLLWSVARAHRLDTDDAADVVQNTWLRLLDHLDRIREPEALAGPDVARRPRERDRGSGCAASGQLQGCVDKPDLLALGEVHRRLDTAPRVSAPIRRGPRARTGFQYRVESERRSVAAKR